MSEKPPAYPLSEPQPVTTTIVTQPVVVQQPIFRDFPVTITDSEGQQVQTIVEFRYGMLTWVAFGLICLLSGCICIAIIPFFVDVFKDAYHISPTDGSIVGVYKRI